MAIIGISKISVLGSNPSAPASWENANLNRLARDAFRAARLGFERAFLAKRKRIYQRRAKGKRNFFIMNRNLIILLIIVIALVGAGYFIFIQKPANIDQPSEIATSPKLDDILELKIRQGETISVPGTDVKIKAIRISETCTHVPPPDCGDEATLQFSQVELSSTYAFTLRRSSKFPPSEDTYTFFGHKITVTDVRDTEATLVVDIQEEVMGNTSGWLIARNSEAGFELQHPRIFEFEDKGEVTPAPQLYYNHWVIIRAQGREFPEFLTVLIYNNVNQNLNEFANSHIFLNDTTPKSSAVGSKKVMESLHVGLDGETKNYFWLDSAKKRGVIFGINPAKAENLSNFHKIIESFRFSK
jgi:hypothetical protein